MVHIFCLNEKCRNIVHLDDHEYWNFKGKVKCSRCGSEIELEIRDGKLVDAKKIVVK